MRLRRSFAGSEIHLKEAFGFNLIFAGFNHLSDVFFLQYMTETCFDCHKFCDL